MGLRMLGPAYFTRALTEQRPLRPTCPKPCRDNGGTDCKAA